MKKQIIEHEWHKEQIWGGCMLASIAHAIMVAHYPELSNEHSWDGINYNVQDSSGARGTVTFGSNYFIAAFRNENSERLNQRKSIEDATNYFQGAPIEVLNLAENETLQYLMEDIQSTAKPLITTSLWGTDNNSYSLDSLEELLENGAFLLEFQLSDFEEAVESWKEYYDMSPEQSELLTSIYNRKITSPLDVIVLSKKEIQTIGTDDEEGLNESEISFGEIGIKWVE